MPPVILLLSTAVSWLGTARMARSLARAGFAVALLAPDGSLAARSRFVARESVLPRDATPAVWLEALIRAVDDFAPALVVPCDEMAVRLLFVLTLEPPTWLPSTVHLRLAALVERSMGNRAYFLDSVDKLRLPAAAQAAGVALPPHALAGSFAEAREFAQARGYPVVLKRRYGFAGEGVAVVAGPDDLATALRARLAGEPVPPMPPLPAATGPVVTVFPREWLRDPGSRCLVDFPVDVPWDDPELIEAMLAMRPPA